LRSIRIIIANESQGEGPVYICVCNAIRECELRAKARQCRDGVDAIYEALGKQPQCGQCLDEAAEILIDEREKVMARA
jgi:bacterioferritin-associated ferredoxin